MTNEVFNCRRFGAWFKYDLKQMWRNQMKAAIGIGLSGLILYAIVISFNLVVHQTWQGPNADGRIAVFVIAFIALEFLQTRTYGFLTKKSKGSAWLMAPASTLEKWTGMMIMTLIVIPVLFLVAYFGVDWLLCSIDHTLGNSIISDISGVVSNYRASLVAGTDMVGIGSLIWILIATFCVNFLYFLLCGVVFKKHKIIWGLVVMFVVSMLLSLIGNASLNMDIEISSREMLAGSAPSEMINRIAAISTVIAAGLAGGVFYRLKTIKH